MQSLMRLKVEVYLMHATHYESLLQKNTNKSFSNGLKKAGDVVCDARDGSEALERF